MKILLTGANGMVGKNILESPLSSQFDFIFPSSSELNLLDKEEVGRFLKKQSPDMVIHAAGIVGGIQANIANPVKFLVDNMQMGLNILTEARNAGVMRFMNLSSLNSNILVVNIDQQQDKEIRMQRIILTMLQAATGNPVLDVGVLILE